MDSSAATASGTPAPAADPSAQASERRSAGERKQIAAALGLIQRLPPQDLEANLTGFAKVAPHLGKALEPYVTRPLQLKRDPDSNQYFVACEYNSDGGGHRSPWSNKYVPAPSGGEAEEERLFRPSERLRRLEEMFNEVFDAYKTGYYCGGVSSVYLWDLDEGFVGAFLIRKELPAGSLTDKVLEKGVWESVHIMEVRESASTTNLAEYKLSTTVRLHLESTEAGRGESELGALVTRQVELRSNRGKKAVGDEMHLMQIGRMIEEMEISIRQSLHSVHIAKQQEVLNAVRSLEGKSASDLLRRREPPEESQVDGPGARPAPAPGAPAAASASPAGASAVEGAGACAADARPAGAFGAGGGASPSL